MAHSNSPTPCKVCSGRARFLCVTHCSHNPSMALHHHRCATCGLVFVADQFTNDQLSAAYDAVNGPDYYAEVGATEKLKFRTALENLKLLGATVDSSLLDVGTGNGDFLVTCHEAGFSRLAGHEIPSTDTTPLDALGIRVYRDYDYSTLPADGFDVVTMLDVMEHVPNPHAVAAAVFRALKPGGIWYFHTPFVTPVDRLMHGVQQLPVVSRFGRAWQRSRTSIYHLQNYTPAAIRQVMQPLGFEDVQIHVENELSWPLRRYLKVYVTNPLRLPEFTTALLAPLAAPLIATNLMNPNKGIVAARKPLAAAVPLRRAA